MITTPILACPLCGETKQAFHSEPLSNLYSEKMAMVTGEEESVLLAHFHNVQCISCGLVYKKEAYPDAVIQSIFRDVVPDHPKGWDVMSGRFTADNFLIELHAYALAIEQKNIEQINRYRRALLSLVDSIYPHEPNSKLKKQLSDAIEQQDIRFIEEQAHQLHQVMVQPMPFKRFSGFSAPELWQYLTLKCGDVIEYDELGCPLWGLLAYAKSLGVDTQFVKRPELNYWSENCRREGVHCIEWLSQQHRVSVKTWQDNRVDEKRQLVGFFQYLDHLSRPDLFLDQIFQQYNSAAVILDGIDEPVYIQHFTGWTTKALEFVASRYNKFMHTDFDLITPSGNRLYLFTDSR